MQNPLQRDERPYCLIKEGKAHQLVLMCVDAFGDLIFGMIDTDMHVAFQPVYTSLARTVPLIHPALNPAKVGGGFLARFGKAKTKAPAVDDLESYTYWVETDSQYGPLNTPFRENCKEVIALVLKSLPSKLSDELLSKGLTFAISNTQYVGDFPTVMHPDYIGEHLEYLKSGQIDRNTLYNNVAEAIAIYIPFAQLDEFPGCMTNVTMALKGISHFDFENILQRQPNRRHQKVQDLLKSVWDIAKNQQGAPVDDETVLKLNALLFALASIETSDSGASYLSTNRTIMLHGNKNLDGNVDYYSKQELLDTVYHEVWHAIDSLARNQFFEKLQGPFLSSHPEFYRLLCLDQAEAISIEQYNIARQKSLNDDAFPKLHFKDMPLQYRSMCLREAFAEIGESLREGGYEQRTAPLIYPRARQWVKHNVLTPYQRPMFSEKPLQWLSCTLSMAWNDWKVSRGLSKITKVPEVEDDSANNINSE